MCEKNHCYDISKKGYVNFITNQKTGSYSKELFAHRQKIFKDGFYKDVLSAAAEMLSAFAPLNGTACLLDVGCGEGYYSRELSQREPFQSRFHLFGADLSKDAIHLAASHDTGKEIPVNWMVANLSNLPFGNESMDFILDILTPANYEEFARILTKTGKLLKIIPGSDYLKEIRNLLSGQLRHEAYSNQPVADHMGHKFSILEKRKLSYTCPVTKDQAISFLSMTPLTFGADLSSLSPESLTAVTIDFDLIAAGRPAVIS